MWGRRGWATSHPLLLDWGTVDTAIWSDLLSLARAIRFVRGARAIISSADRTAAEFTAGFDCCVRPLLDSIVESPLIREKIAESMLSYATKSGFVVAGYANMTGVPFATDLVVLGLSFTRLYDDMLDDWLDADGSPDLAQRLRELIEHGRFSPGSDLERLLERLYREIDRKAGRERDDPLYRAANSAHRYQVASSCQRDPRISHARLVDVTRGKGRYGTLTVFALVRPRLCARECELIMEVGEALSAFHPGLDVLGDKGCR